MSSFEISNVDRKWSARLNGVEIGPMIRDGGVQIEFQEGGQPPIVHLQMVPERIVVRLPEALVELAEVAR